MFFSLTEFRETEALHESLFQGPGRGLILLTLVILLRRQEKKYILWNNTLIFIDLTFLYFSLTSHITFWCALLILSQKKKTHEKQKLNFILVQLKLNVINREMEVNRMLKATKIRSVYFLWLLLVCFVVWQIEIIFSTQNNSGKEDLMQDYLWKELGQIHRKTNENWRRYSCLLSDLHLTKQRQVQQRAIWQSQAPRYQRTVFPWLSQRVLGHS